MGSTDSGKGFKSRGEYQHNISSSGDAGMPTGTKNQGMLHKPKESQNIHPIFVIQENSYSSDRLVASLKKELKPGSSLACMKARNQTITGILCAYLPPKFYGNINK